MALQQITKEPSPGSVVLVHGAQGTAAQRFKSDGKFRYAGDETAYAFEDLLDHAGHGGVLLLKEG